MKIIIVPTDEKSISMSSSTVPRPEMNVVGS